MVWVGVSLDCCYVNPAPLRRVVGTPCVCLDFCLSGILRRYGFFHVVYAFYAMGVLCYYLFGGFGSFGYFCGIVGTLPTQLA
jgi:hypothetical protein